MKIYGNDSFFTEKTGIRNAAQMKAVQENRKITEFAGRFIEEHRADVKDRITVSREGMDYIREQLSEMENRTDSDTGTEKSLTQITHGVLTPSDQLYADYIRLNIDTVDENGVSQNLCLDLNAQFLHEMEGKDSRDWNQYMEALAKAYTSVRQHITRGYEEGTREVWIQDDRAGEDFDGTTLEIDGQTVHYRRLTKEEEIRYLDKSLDQFTQDVAKWYVKEEAAVKREEAEKEAYEAYKEENKGWIAFERLVNRLVDEARNLFDKVREEIAKLEAMNKNEIDFEGRMEAEAYNYRAETVERGRKQSQLENYRKISQMTSDVAALWGNIRA